MMGLLLQQTGAAISARKKRARDFKRSIWIVSQRASTDKIVP